MWPVPDPFSAQTGDVLLGSRGFLPDWEAAFKLASHSSSAFSTTSILW